MARHRRRRRADPRDPHRRRQFAAVPALRLPRAGPATRRRDAARLHRREPRPAPRPLRPGTRAAEPDPHRRPPRHRQARDRNRRRNRARRRHAAARAARRRRRRRPIAAAPRRRHPRDRVALSSDRHRHDRGARAAACRHRRRAFPARRPVRDPADDRRAAPPGARPPRGRSSIVWTEHADLAPRLIALPGTGFRRRIARPFRRVSRRDRTRWAALDLSSCR